MCDVRACVWCVPPNQMCYPHRGATARRRGDGEGDAHSDLCATQSRAGVAGERQRRRKTTDGRIERLDRGRERNIGEEGRGEELDFYV